MYYNIATRGLSSTTHTYLTVITLEEVEKFVLAYDYGKDNARINGIKIQVKNLASIKIFSTNEWNATEPNIIKNELRKRAVIFNRGKLSIPILREFGEDLTSQFIKGEWGEKKAIQIASQSKALTENYVDISRIEELKAIVNQVYDLKKIIRLCEEVNASYKIGNLFSVGTLIRAIMDHLPPAFECKNFDEVANNYKSEGDSKSFKESMQHLNNSMKKISDSFLHSQIRKSEVLPNRTQIDCRRDLDKLLAEVIRVLNVKDIASKINPPKLNDFFKGKWNSEFVLPGGGGRHTENNIAITADNKFFVGTKHMFNIDMVEIDPQRKKIKFRKVNLDGKSDRIMNELTIINENEISGIEDNLTYGNNIPITYRRISE